MSRFLAKALAFPLGISAAALDDDDAPPARLPTGKQVTPLACPHSKLEYLNPGLPDFPNFLAGQAFFATPLLATRKVALRSALTLSPDRDGAFDVLLGLVRHGLGGALGPGTEYTSWIHDIDFARAVDWIIAHDGLQGVVNLASPHPNPNR
jgi:hypothetical protein